MIYLYHIGYQVIWDILEYLTLSVPVYIGFFFIYLCIFLHLHFNYLNRHATPAKVIIKKNKKLLAVSVPDTWLAHLFFAFLPYDTF